MERQEEINKLVYECLQGIIKAYDYSMEERLTRLRSLISVEEPAPSLDTFQSHLWRDKIYDMFKGIPILQCVQNMFLLENYNHNDCVTIEPDTKVLLDNKKFFAFKVDDIETVQSSEQAMKLHLNSIVYHNIEDVITENILKRMFSDIDILKRKRITEPMFRSDIYHYLVEIAEYLKNSNPENVNKDVKPFLLVSPYIESLILEIPQFIPKYNISDISLRSEATGRIAGMDVIVLRNTILSGDEYIDSCKNCNLLIAGTNQDTLMAHNISKIESLRDKDTFSDLIRGLYLYGIKINQKSSLHLLTVEK